MQPNPLRDLSRFFKPLDLDAANAEWGANCGPMSLAATLRCQVARVRQHFPDFDRKRYVNAGDMNKALVSAIIPASKTGWNEWPMYGVALIQIAGPWTAPGVHWAAALKHTHWVATQNDGEGRWVWDCNADQWFKEHMWRDYVLPEIVKEHARASGEWAVRCGFDFPDPIDAAAVEPGPVPRFEWAS